MTYAAKLDALIAGELPADGFSHADHVGVAVAALARFEPFEAFAVVARGLRLLAAGAGVPEKFNATVTLAWLSRIAERIETTGCRDPAAFVADNPGLIEPGWLERRYGSDCLRSSLARTVPLLPRH